MYFDYIILFICKKIYNFCYGRSLPATNISAQQHSRNRIAAKPAICSSNVLFTMSAKQYWGKLILYFMLFFPPWSPSFMLLLSPCPHFICRQIVKLVLYHTWFIWCLRKVLRTLHIFGHINWVSTKILLHPSLI